MIGSLSSMELCLMDITGSGCCSGMAVRRGLAESYGTLDGKLLPPTGKSVWPVRRTRPGSAETELNRGS